MKLDIEYDIKQYDLILIKDLIRKIDYKNIIINYINDLSIVNKTEIIESILLNIPLPIIILNQSNDGRLNVNNKIISTIFEFYNNKIILESKYNDLNNKLFKDLDLDIKNRFINKSMNFYIAKPTTNINDVNERFNSLNVFNLN